MTSKPLQRFLRMLTTCISIATAACIIFVGAALLRLYHEPLDLSTYTQDLAKALKPTLGRVDLSMRAPRLIWRGFGYPLEVEAHDLSLHQEGAKTPLATAPEVRISFRFRSLLVGQFLPSTLTLNRPTLWVSLPEQSSQAPSDNAALTFVEETFLTPSHSKTLKHFHVMDATLHLSYGAKAWAPIQTSFAFERKHGGLDATLSLSTKEATGHAHLSYGAGDGLWQADVGVTHLNLMETLDALADFEGPWTAWRTYLQGSRLQLTGEGSLTWGNTQGISHLDLRAKCDEGTLSLPPSLLEKPLAFQGARLNGTIKDGRLTLWDTQLSTQGTSLSFTGEGSFPTPQNPKGDMTLQAALTHLPMGRVPHLWPKDAAPDAREWLVKNIPEGIATKANATLTSTLICEDNSALPCMTFQNIKGDIFLEKGRLTYLPTMPAIKDIAAHAVFDKNHFDIALSKGTSEGLTLSKGQVLITDMTGNNPHLAIKVNVDGPLGGAFAIINCPPLESLKDLPVSLKDHKGQVKGLFELAFPLKNDLMSQDFTYGVDLDVTGLAFHNLLSQMGVDLEDASAHITIKDRLLSCQAQGHINGDKGDIALEVGLQDKGHTHLKVHTLATTTGLARLGVNLTPYMIGSASLSLDLNNPGGEQTTLDIDANLKDTSLTYGAWTKAIHVPGALKAKILLTKGALTTIDHATFIAPEADISLTATFGKGQNHLQTLNVSKGKLGQSELQATISPGKYKDLMVKINAHTLDLAPYIATLKEPSTGDTRLGRTFEMRLKADKIILGDAQILKGNTLSLSYDKERIQIMTYKGHFDEALKKFFYIDIIPRAQDGRKFRLTCENGGAFFKAFDLTRNLSKGTLKIVAEQSRQDGAPWIGKAEYDNFWVKDAPLLGRLLSLAFPTGLVNFFSDKGLQFDRLKAHFTLGQTKLLVPQGRAHGPSLGMTMKGALSDNFETLHFEGNIYPAYFVNSAISKIPVLGQLLTGGKHEGLWGVSYTIEGPRDNAHIGVNPLSAFTPGILRKLFSMDSDDDMVFDDKEMDHENVLE